MYNIVYCFVLFTDQTINKIKVSKYRLCNNINHSKTIKVNTSMISLKQNTIHCWLQTLLNWPIWTAIIKTLSRMILWKFFWKIFSFEIWNKNYAYIIILYCHSKCKNLKIMTIKIVKNNCFSNNVVYSNDFERRGKIIF